MYLNEEQQRGYDARHEPTPFGPTYFDGGFDYQQGWDLAAGEERRERAHREELQQQQQAEEQHFQDQMMAEMEEQQQQELQQDMIYEATHPQNQR